MMSLATRTLLPLLLLSMSVCSDALAAPPLGRVFYTPAERRALELADRGERAAAVENTHEARPGSPGAIRYSGIVRRSQGPTTGFVDGRPIDRNAVGEQNVRLEGDRLVIDSPGGARRLKPGENFAPDPSTPTDGSDARP